MQKKVLSAVALAAAALFSTHACADDLSGKWLVRARAVSLTSSNGDSTGLGLSVNNIVLPEVDFSYFMTSNIAAELILTVPQQHDVRSNGSKIGTVTQLPPTLLLQYHFNLNGYKPYVGAGVNYTKFTTSDISSGSVTTDNASWGGALQVGVDVPVTKTMYFNFDVKKVQIATNINSGGNSAGTLRVDPWLVGVGLGWRF